MQKDPERPYLVLGVLTFTTALTSYVEAMVIPSLPHIEQALSATNEEAAWIVSAYLVVGAAIAPLFGKMGDTFGKKRLYLISLALYSLAVLFAGFSPNVYSLIGARAIQGFGFSIFPLSIAIITDIFPKERVALAQGILSAMVAIGMTIGMIAGAYIDEYLGWRAMFHIAFGIAIVAIIVSYINIGPHPPVKREKIDYLSSTLLSIGTALILIYLTEAPYKGWVSLYQLPVIASGLILFIGFLFYINKSQNPLIRPNLLKIKNVMVANLAGLFSGVTMFTLYLSVIYFAEEPSPYGLGLSVINAALSLLPATLAMIIIAPIVGIVVSSLGPKPVLIYGSIVSLIGFSLFIYNRGGTIPLIMDSFVTGIGIISIMTPIVNMIAISMPEDSVTVGLGFNTMIRFLGSSIGPVMTANLMTTFVSYVAYYMPNIGFSFFTEPGPEAFNYTFFIGVIFSFLTLITSLFTKNYISQRRNTLTTTN
ncbi:MAG: MFS transporter [Caldisphaera sp.]|jgi:EmrB/QacA subfamily drug resistance transporter|nr:MFS transporter [Caldisphaera sp.]